MPYHIFLSLKHSAYTGSNVCRVAPHTQQLKAVYTGRNKANIANPFVLCVRSRISAWSTSEIEQSIILLGFVVSHCAASSITDFNEFYCLLSHHIAHVWYRHIVLVVVMFEIDSSSAFLAVCYSKTTIATTDNTAQAGIARKL